MNDLPSAIYGPLSGIITISADTGVTIFQQGIAVQPGTTFACDINADGVASVADVQQIINEALGAAQAVDDLSGDRMITVVDVQMVANAVLTLGCVQ